MIDKRTFDPSWNLDHGPIEMVGVTSKVIGLAYYYYVYLLYKDGSRQWQATTRNEENAKLLKQRLEKLIDSDGYMTEDNKYKMHETVRKIMRRDRDYIS